MSEAERTTATVSVATAASILGVHKATLYEAIERGDQPFPIIRVGARILIPREPLERLVRGLVIDLDAARRYLAESLPADEPLEISAEDVLDDAAAVVVNGKAAMSR